jgi:WD40 repeat protein
MVWSPDGEFIAYVDNIGTHVMNSDLDFVATLPNSMGTRSIDWSPDSGNVVGANRDGTLRVWRRTEQGEFVHERVLQGPQDNQIVADWSPDGHWIASLAGTTIVGRPLNDVTAYLWDTQDWQLERTLDETYNSYGDFPPLSIEWTADSQHIIFVGASADNGIVRDINVYDTTSGERAERYSTIEYPHSIALNPVDDDLIAAGTIRDIELIHRNQVSVAPFLDANPSNHIVRDMEWSPDGRWLAFGNLGGWISILDPARGVIATNSQPDLDILMIGIQWSPAGTELLTVGGEANVAASTFQLWDVSDLPDLSGTPTLTPIPTRTPTVTPTVAPSTPVS